MPQQFSTIFTTKSPSYITYLGPGFLVKLAEQLMLWPSLLTEVVLAKIGESTPSLSLCVEDELLISPPTSVT